MDFTNFVHSLRGWKRKLSKLNRESSESRSRRSSMIAQSRRGSQSVIPVSISRRSSTVFDPQQSSSEPKLFETNPPPLPVDTTYFQNVSRNPIYWTEAESIFARDSLHLRRKSSYKFLSDQIDPRTDSTDSYDSIRSLICALSKESASDPNHNLKKVQDLDCTVSKILEQIQTARSSDLKNDICTKQKKASFPGKRPHALQPADSAGKAVDNGRTSASSTNKPRTIASPGSCLAEPWELNWTCDSWAGIRAPIPDPEQPGKCVWRLAGAGASVLSQGLRGQKLVCHQPAGRGPSLPPLGSRGFRSSTSLAGAATPSSGWATDLNLLRSLSSLSRRPERPAGSTSDLLADRRRRRRPIKSFYDPFRDAAAVTRMAPLACVGQPWARTPAGPGGGGGLNQGRDPRAIRDGSNSEDLAVRVRAQPLSETVQAEPSPSRSDP